MFTDERVQTGPRGKTQLLFLDGSALSVGPNSDLVLDTFVYDSETKTGTLALSTTKGLFRFVGGRISKKSPVTLRTPTATIGIRGGIITARVSATLTRSTFHFGDEMTVSAGGVTKSTSRPGNAITATPEAPPSDPQPASGDQLAEDLGGLEKAEGDPDTEVAVGDDDVAASQIAELGSQGEPEVLGGGGGSESEGATGSDDAGGQDAEAEGKANEQDAANVLCSQQANAASCGNGDRDDIVSTASGSSSSSIANATNTTSGFAGGRGKRGTDVTVGTADTTAGQNFALTDAALSGNLFTATTSAGNYRLHVPDSSGNFTLGDDATARPAETPFGATTGNGFLSPNRGFVFFKLNGSRQFVFGGVQTPASAFPTTGGTNFAMVSDFALGDSRLAFLPANTGGTLTSTETNAFIYWNRNGDSTNIRPLFAQSVVINGNGTSQNSAFTVLTGAVFTGDSDRILIRGTQVGGSRIDGTQRVFNGFVASASNGISGGIFGTASPDYFVLEAARLNDAGTPINGSEGVAVATAGSTAGATIFPNAAFGTQEVSSESAITRSTHLASNDNQLKGFASGIVQSFDSSGNFVQASKLLNNTVSSTNPQEVVQVEYNAATSLVQATFDLKNGLGSGPFSTIAPKFGSFGLTNGTNAYVSDELFGARGQSSNSRIDGSGLDGSDHAFFRVTNDKIKLENSPFPSNVSLCTCAFAKWGFWGGEYRETNGERHYTHLATWVASQVPNSSQVPTSGSATYTGFTLGTVRRNANTSPGFSYTAAGNVSATINFNSSTYNVNGTITDLDGGSFSITGTGVAGVSGFTATIGDVTDPTAVAGNYSGTFNGMFAGSGTPPEGLIGQGAIANDNSPVDWQYSGIVITQR